MLQNIIDYMTFETQMWGCYSHLTRLFLVVVLRVCLVLCVLLCGIVLRSDFTSCSTHGAVL